jgi:predicted dehydrogenase
MLAWLCGYPTEVVAFGNKKGLADWPILHDSVIAAYKFPNDVIGKVFVSTGCRRQYTNRLQIWGTKGTILCESNTGKVLFWEQNEELGIKASGEPQVIPVEIHGHNTDGELLDFVTALDNGTPFPVSSWQGMATVCACVAAVESARRDGEKIVIEYPAE